MSIYDSIKNNLKQWQWQDKKDEVIESTETIDKTSDADDLMKTIKHKMLINKIMKRETTDYRYATNSISLNNNNTNMNHKNNKIYQYQYSSNSMSNGGGMAEEIAKMVTAKDFDLLNEYKELQKEISSDSLLREEWDKFIFFRKLRKAEDNDTSR